MCTDVDKTRGQCVMSNSVSRETIFRSSRQYYQGVCVWYKLCIIITIAILGLAIMSIL